MVALSGLASPRHPDPEEKEVSLGLGDNATTDERLFLYLRILLCSPLLSVSLSVPLHHLGLSLPRSLFFSSLSLHCIGVWCGVLSDVTLNNRFCLTHTHTLRTHTHTQPYIVLIPIGFQHGHIGLPLRCATGVWILLDYKTVVKESR